MFISWILEAGSLRMVSKPEKNFGFHPFLPIGTTDDLLVGAAPGANRHDARVNSFSIIREAVLVFDVEFSI